MANKIGSDIQRSMGKTEKVKIWMGILVLVGLILVATNLTSYLDKSKESEKIQVIKKEGTGVIELSEDFEFEPNYSDFFNVDDELEEGKVYVVSKGELEIRKVLGSKMYRAKPRSIQAKSKAIDYKTIVSESGPSKGQVICVVGKVVKIRKLRSVAQILSKQFVHSVFIEDQDGGLFDCRSIRLPFDLSLGDVVSMSGVYIKLKKEKGFSNPLAILFGNSIQSVLPKPFFWENAALFKTRVELVKKQTSRLIAFPKKELFQQWVTSYDALVKANTTLWGKIDDSSLEKSKKLPVEFEKILVENLSYTNKNTILSLSQINKDYQDLLKNKDKYRGKITKVVGTLVYLNEIRLDNKLGQASRLYYAKVKDLKGDEYLFNFLKYEFIDQLDRMALNIKSKLIPKPGDIVTCSGVFVQLVLDGKKQVPLVYGKQMSAVGTYEEIWDSIDHIKRGNNNNLGLGARERQLSGTIDKRPYVYLLNKLSYMSPDDVKNKYLRLKKGDATTWSEFMTEPELFVDKPYYRYGRVKLIREIDGLNYYDFHGLKKIYEMYIVDKDSHLHTLYSLNKPSDLVVNSKVFFDGYFFKKFTYPTIGNQLQWNPLIVGHIHTVEKRVVKTMSQFEIILLIGTTLAIVFFMVYISQQHNTFRQRINHLRANQFKRDKLTREEIKKLNVTGKDLTNSLLINLHFSFFDDIKIPIELCQSIDHWSGHLDDANGQWRPEYLNSYFKSVLEHYSQYDTELPKDIKLSFLNKRKEMLGLRAYQKSKLDLPEGERKRIGSIMITPVSNIKNKPTELDRLDGYFDEYGLPPWNTWVSFSSLPKNVIKNPNSGYKPQTQVIVSWVPIWMEEKLKAVVPTLEVSPRSTRSDDSTEG